MVNKNLEILVIGDRQDVDMREVQRVIRELMKQDESYDYSVSAETSVWVYSENIPRDVVISAIEETGYHVILPYED